MNKTKLLVTSALAGVIGLAGAASAEIGGAISHTMTFGSDDSADSATSNTSGNRLGTEYNLTMSGKKDLDNGGYAAFSGKWEYDGAGSSHPDLEYEMQYGMGDFYVGLANDGGNKLSGFAGNYVSYFPGSLAKNVVSSGGTADGFLSAIDESDNISLNGKVAGGTVTFRYTPNTSADHGNDIDNMAESGSSGTTMVYKGTPMDGLTLKIGRTQTEDTGQSDKSETKIGASYNFGSFTLGYDQSDYEAATTASTSDKKLKLYTGTYALNDATTLGLSFHTIEAGGANSNNPDEDVISLTAGYNLGGAAFTVSYVDVQNSGNTRGEDANGLVLTSAFKF